MKFECPKCEQRLQCDDTAAGMVVKCPGCGTRITVPEAPAAPPTQTKRVVKKPRSTSSGRRPAPTASRGSRQKRKWTDSTNVSALGCLAIGAGFTLGFYLLVLPMRRLYLGELFLNRGWVPYVLVLLVGWIIGFLILKSRKLSSQKNALLLDLLPSSVSEEIDAETVDAFIAHVDRVPNRLRDSFMIKRIKKGLEHFAVRHSNPEVASLMMSQSEIDAGAVHSSYSLAKVVIWAIPILGFIGTVLGISAAVGGFSGALDSAQDVEVLKQSLNGVTSGLSTAFDTTLVALVMSLMASFPVSMMQKREEDFLGQVDEYCTENLIKRLNDAGGLADVAGHTNVMMQALGNAMSQNQGELLEGLVAAQDRLSDVHAQQVEYYQSVNASMDSQTLEHTQRLEAQLNKIGKAMQSTLTEMTQKVNALVESQVKASTKTSREHQTNVEALVQRLSEPVDKSVSLYTEGLTEGLGRLNQVLGELGEKQVIIQQQPRRGLFGRRKDK